MYIRHYNVRDTVFIHGMIGEAAHMPVQMCQTTQNVAIPTIEDTHQRLKAKLLRLEGLSCKALR